MDLKKSNFEDIIKKEWIITNGLGGFASSTVAGANTRRYLLHKDIYWFQKLMKV